MKNKQTYTTSGKNLVKYIYPYLYGGEFTGINNSGMENFSKNPNGHLVKEVIQNSLDAKDKYNNLPVKVSFKLLKLNNKSIPDIKGMKNTLESCKKSDESEKAQNIIEDALKILDNEEIYVLEISDYNTTGLKGANSREKSDFKNLVGTSGLSNKSDEAGGSFGIGKNAPFLCSKLRTIIYSSLDDENVLALQGVSRWASHTSDGIDRQGVGYLAIEEENGENINFRPFIGEELNIFDNTFIRNKVGTSLFVLGFNENEDWKIDFIKATIDNYFVAILNGNLEVEIEDVNINKDTIEEIIDKYFDYKKDRLTISYNEVLKLGKVFNEEIEELGSVKLYLLVGEELDKKIAYVRSNGMKIIDKGFRFQKSFIGVLKLNGNRLNKFIKSLENVSHDDIILGKSGDLKYNKVIMKKIDDFIKKSIKDVIGENNESSFNFSLLAKQLPSNFENDKASNDTESINKILSDLVLLENKIKKKSEKKITSKKSNNLDDVKYKGNIKGNSNLDEGFNEEGAIVGNWIQGKDELQGKVRDPLKHGNITNYSSGDNDVYEESRLSTGIKEKNLASGNIDKQSAKFIQEEKVESKKYNNKINIKKSRVFSSGNVNEYIVFIETSNDCESKIEVKIIGEDCRAEKATIIGAKYIESEEDIMVNGSIIGPLIFKKNKLVRLKVKLDVINKCSLEVKGYEDKR